MERKIVFKALVGSHNYNLNTESSDRDYKVFVLPTFEDLYEGKMYSKSIIGADEDLDIHDVRKLVDLFFKANINFLEVLYSKEIIIPDDLSFMEKVYIRRLLAKSKEIVKMNLPHLFNACGGMYKNKMNQLYKGTEGTQHLVDKFGYDTKQALHAFRVMNFIVRFSNTDFEDFKGAMAYGHYGSEFMLKIKNGDFTAGEFEEMVKNYHDEKFAPLKEKYYSFEPNYELKEELTELIMKLVKSHITK